MSNIGKIRFRKRIPVQCSICYEWRNVLGFNLNRSTSRDHMSCIKLKKQNDTINVDLLADSRMFIVVDKIKVFFDFDRLSLVSKYIWSLSKRNDKIRYAYTVKDGKKLRMHHILFGGPKKGEVYDHIDSNPLNNTANNLRLCFQAQNTKNKTKYKGKSKFKGVYFKGFLIFSKIESEGRSYYLGSFESELEAAKAYDTAALRLHKTFAKTNKMLGLI